MSNHPTGPPRANLSTDARLTAVDAADGALAHLREACAVVVRGAFAPEVCARWARATLDAREAWTADFGGEQFSLGRAFYAHFEEDHSRAYFAAAAQSDALVERVLPGLQSALRALLARATQGHVRARHGWCGPGVHVFPAGGKVARLGGVVHADTEGLADHHRQNRGRAVTLVLMLQPGQRHGGLKVWNATTPALEIPRAASLPTESVLVNYRAGDVALIDSYRVHQIQPFTGRCARISATLHAAETSPDVWETWF